MIRLRALIADRRRLAMALVVLAFLAKAVIPAGFMLLPSRASFVTISVCSDATGDFKQIHIATPGKQDSGPVTGGEKKDGVCAFAGLAKAAMSGADTILLALALAWILVLGLVAPPRLAACAPDHLRPPLRAPPATA